MNRFRNRGFTLIELVIVMAVLAVLAAVAVNAYRDYVLESNRTEAMSALTELAQRQEEYFGNRQAYTGSLSTLNVSATTDNGLYQLSIEASATTSYTLRATPIDTQVQDQDCEWFELNSLGQRTAENTDCWQR